MGLKMPSDEEILASKILLNRASAKSRAKSWMTTSLGEEIETSSRVHSLVNTEDADDDLTVRNANDENSGIGATPKIANDDLSNRQLMSTNEALRKKLLSKDAYHRYNQGPQRGSETLRPKVKKVDSAIDDDEESKGKSSRIAHSGRIKVVPRNDDRNTEGEDGSSKIVMSSSLTKKRPNSYLDQLLESRRGKQQKKTKKPAGDD